MAKQYVEGYDNRNELPLLLRFSLPMLVGNIFQQFYNMVDSIVVGNYVGTNALAAVGMTSSLNFCTLRSAMDLQGLGQSADVPVFWHEK